MRTDEFTISELVCLCGGSYNYTSIALWLISLAKHLVGATDAL